MAEPSFADVSAPVPDPDAAYQAFHEYRWDLDKDFLGGLVLALGGYHALAQTASQADIVMHSRIFYYARVSGITIPYTGYRQWLVGAHRAGQQPRVWEWDLLEALCNHRDRLTSAQSSSVAQRREEAAAEKARWTRELLSALAPHAQSDLGDSNGSSNGQYASMPGWMAAAPKSELYIDRRAAANHGDDDASSPAYPERFAQIIRAVQTGEPVEGIVEIPDIVARNPTTTPIGTMQRPPKPWERAAQQGVGTALDEGHHSVEAYLDQSFPDQEEAAVGST